MIKKKYDKLPPEQKRIIDQEVAFILSPNGETTVIRIEYGGTGYSGPVYGSDGNLIYPGGGGPTPFTGKTGVLLRENLVHVKSVTRVPVDGVRKKNRLESQYELIFPRRVDGSPVVSSEQSRIIVLLVGDYGPARYSFQFSKDLSPEMKRKASDYPDGRYMFEFRPKEMVYQGKLEY